MTGAYIRSISVFAPTIGRLPNSFDTALQMMRLRRTSKAISRNLLYT
nr:MAG TPA: hypothetical protein [Caudoviricetes sp.]